MPFKKVNIGALIEDYISTNPDRKKYFYCEHCGGKMVFSSPSENGIRLQCRDCGREAKED